MSNKLFTQKELFLNGHITKPEYFETIYDCHEYLFNYSEFIKNTNISKIEIEDESVIFTCRNSQIKLLCPKGEKRSIPLTMLSLGEYESEELDLQLQLIKDGDTIFDIGGNIGWYALHIAKSYPSAIIHSFEPVPWTFNQLEKNLQLNNKVKNVIPHNIGFSDKTGDFEFFFDPAISGNASLTNVAEKENIQIFKCKVETLDKYIEDENQKIDFIKCDVEGAEFFVFKGGLNTIKKYQPVIFTEMLRKWSAKFNYHPNDIIDFFEQIDYLPYVNYDKCKLHKFDRVDDNTIETNYFFLHKEKHADLIKKFVVE
jgi:FkbM family methyltransferase